MSQSDKTPGKENSEHEFSDKATREKIDKHLSDINDKISEEDIRNVNTDITSGESDDGGIENANNEPAANSIPPDEEVPEIPSPWDVIE